jgi:hypothetical protein
MACNCMQDFTELQAHAACVAIERSMYYTGVLKHQSFPNSDQVLLQGSYLFKDVSLPAHSLNFTVIDDHVREETLVSVS